MKERSVQRIGVVSLGCDKNRVDTEKMLFRLKEAGYALTADETEADLLIVNTCAFLEASRREAVEEVIGLKARNPQTPILVTGCLPQGFSEELIPALTEADGFLGTGQYGRVAEAVSVLLAGGRFLPQDMAHTDKAICGRVVTTPAHYAYLSLADGCDNRCAYCLIPHIRGHYRSRPLEELAEEAAMLLAGGAKELILVAQDLTRYGRDLYGEYALGRALRTLSALPGLPDNALRLMYCYPELVTPALMDELRDNPKIIKYIDVPFQHIADPVLAAMRRRMTGSRGRELIAALRENVPGISVRSTFITGFPGETEADFAELLAFIETARFDNAGFFAFSRERGTPAYAMPDQVPARVKQSRLKALYAAQHKHYAAWTAAAVGTVVRVRCDGVEDGVYVGRTAGSAPGVDRKVRLTGSIAIGRDADVRITGGDGVDMAGAVVRLLP